MRRNQTLNSMERRQIALDALECFVKECDNFDEVIDVLEENDPADEFSESLLYEGMTLAQAALLLDGKTFIDILKLNKHLKMDNQFRQGLFQDPILSIQCGPGLRRYTDGYHFENATALHFAVLQGDLEAVNALCHYEGVNINAAANLVSNKHLYDPDGDILNDKGTMDNYDKPGFIASMWICKESVNIMRTCGVTPLHLAYRLGNKEIIYALLKAGVDQKLKDSEGDLPVKYLQKIKGDISINASGAELLYGKITEDDVESLLTEFGRLTTRKYKSRLMFGEADLSYTASLVRKHAEDMPGLSQSIIATELCTEQELAATYPTTFRNNQEYLTQQGVRMIFDVDARNFGAHPDLQDVDYSRIHFNFPHDGSSFKDRTLPVLISDFFQHASNKQVVGNRIDMALPKNQDSDKRKFYEAYVYGIFDASANAGYQLKKKRKFDSERYPGYQHRITGRASSADVAESAREYVFEKTELSFEELNRRNRTPVKKIYGSFYKPLPEIDTDDESSSYEDNDSNNSYGKK